MQTRAWLRPHETGVQSDDGAMRFRRNRILLKEQRTLYDRTYKDGLSLSIALICDKDSWTSESVLFHWRTAQKLSRTMNRRSSSMRIVSKEGEDA